MTEDRLTLADVEASIAATLSPLREQLRVVEANERLILADLEQTRAMKGRLLSTLRKLDPTMPGPGKKKATTNGGSHTEPAKFDQAVVDLVREYVDQVAPANPDGFSRTRVLDAMKAAGQPMGDKRLVMAIEALHSSGYLTLHKVITGGNKSYKRTEDVSNGSPRQAV